MDLIKEFSEFFLLMSDFDVYVFFEVTKVGKSRVLLNFYDERPFNMLL